jgi:hypothetical protein
MGSDPAEPDDPPPHDNNRSVTVASNDLNIFINPPWVMHHRRTAENRRCIMIDYSVLIDKRQINSFEFSTFFFGK